MLIKGKEKPTRIFDPVKKTKGEKISSVGNRQEDKTRTIISTEEQNVKTK